MVIVGHNPNLQKLKNFVEVRIQIECNAEEVTELQLVSPILIVTYDKNEVTSVCSREIGLVDGDFGLDCGFDEDEYQMIEEYLLKSGVEETALSMLDGYFLEGPVVTEEDIAIYDKGGEIVYWHHEEWEVDPSIIPCIVNAINIYYKEGSQALRATLDKYRYGTVEGILSLDNRNEK